MTESDQREIIALASAMDFDTLSMWLSIGKGLSLSEKILLTKPALSLVPRPLLHSLQNRIGSGVERLPSEFVCDTVSG